MTSRQPPYRATLTTGIASVLALVLLSACSSGGTDTASGDSGQAAAARADAARVGPAADFAQKGTAGSGQAGGAGVKPAGLEGAPLGTAALIKTADVSMRADDVTSVVAKISALAIGLGGRVSSENTSSDASGDADEAFVTVEVPVHSFESSVDKIASFGTHVVKETATEDVTAELADVDSRVRSAETSIAQLRRLFSRATKLGEVIAVESELSQREADLEALQAQQRVLQARTTMSTITVNVSRPQTTPAHQDQARGGFWSGLKQGWHGMVTFVGALAHGVGVVLPLGTLVLGIGLLGYVVVRRFIPRRLTRTSE